ncbi:MAG TPA: GIY-YIG nuclease family protein [Chloroflexota bacterium]|nr:GIY-YIG nuclease family protein [Chloroflexota bacterium]
MSCFVYIVECADGTYYTGWTTNLGRRLCQHNHAKTGAHYTRTRRPVLLRYVEICQTRSAAQKREAAIKAKARPGKQALWTANGA